MTTTIRVIIKSMINTEEENRENVTIRTKWISDHPRQVQDKLKKDEQPECRANGRTPKEEQHALRTRQLEENILKEPASSALENKRAIRCCQSRCCQPELKRRSYEFVLRVPRGRLGGGGGVYMSGCAWCVYVNMCTCVCARCVYVVLHVSVCVCCVYVVLCVNV